MNAKIVIIIIILVLFLIVTLQNTEVASFNILFWDIKMSQIVFIFIAILVGFIAGYVVGKTTGRERKPVAEKKNPEFNK